MNDAPRLVPIGYFEGGTSALTIPHEAIARAEQAIAAERLVVGEHVAKVGGDYRFAGVVVSVVVKRDRRTWRYVVENDDGVLHIFSAAQLVRSPKEPT